MFFLKKGLFCLSVCAVCLIGCISAAAAESSVLKTRILPFDRVALSAPGAEKEADTPLIEDGIYRIVNQESGRYIDTYDIRYDKAGHAYMEKKSEKDGQDFRITYQGNGEYRITAMSEGGAYHLYLDGTSLCKTNEGEATFRLKAVGSAYTLEAGSLTLTAGVGTSRYGAPLIGATSYTGADNQLWKLEKVNATGMTISSTAKRVKIYSIHTLLASVVPSYLTDNVKWSSSDESVVLVDKNGSFCALKVGTATITASCGNFEVRCEVEVRDDTAYTWYSQHNMTNGGWDAAALSQLYFSSGGFYKPYMIDGYNGNQDWMDEGCNVAATATVLHNLGAVMEEGYDFRNNQTGNLEADPYTVSLANTYNDGSVDGKGYLRNNPVYLANSAVGSAFTLNHKKLEATTSYYPTKQAIKDALDEHPEGVIVKFKKSNGTHFIVFVECINPDAEKSSQYEFLVCDPAAYDADMGDHVKFEECASYVNSYYRYSQMVQMTVWGVAEESNAK